METKTKNMYPSEPAAAADTLFKQLKVLTSGGHIRSDSLSA
jgi:hypothetical protein